MTIYKRTGLIVLPFCVRSQEAGGNLHCGLSLKDRTGSVSLADLKLKCASLCCINLSNIIKVKTSQPITVSKWRHFRSGGFIGTGCVPIM